MKKLVVKTTTEITYNDLTGKELVAYRSKNSDGYCMLVKLVQKNTNLTFSGSKESYRYGFVPLNNSDSCPRYCGDNWFKALKNASDHRQIFIFDTMEQLIEAMHLKKF